MRGKQKVMTEIFSELTKDTNFQFQEPKESQAAQIKRNSHEDNEIKFQNIE